MRLTVSLRAYFLCLLAIPNFQISTSVHLHLVKMAAHVWILLEVTAVIVKRDILVATAKQVTVSYGIFRETKCIEPCIKQREQCTIIR